MADDATIPLFSYGTLQLEEVQRANFGRTLAGEADAVTGYRMSSVTIADPTVVGLSGIEVHKILVATGDPADVIEGMVLWLTPAELAAADAYETDDYVRVEAVLRSGRRAFVYVQPPETAQD